MSKTTSQARKQRRSYELWLKKNNPQAYKEWKSQSTERGKMLSEQQEEKIREAESTRLEAIQADMINRLESEGKTKEEIDREISIWALTIKPWGSTENKLTRKEAEKQYDLELKS